MKIRRIELFLFYIFLISLVTLPFEMFRIDIGGLNAPIVVFSLFVAILFFYVLQILLTGNIVKYPLFLILGSGGFITFMLFSILMADLPISKINFQRTIEYTFYLSVPFVTITTINNFNKLKKTFYILIFIGASWTTIGLTRFFTGSVPLFSLVKHSGHLGTRNSDVFMLEGLFIITLCFLIFLLQTKTKNKLLSLLVTIATISMIIALILGYSRGGWVATGMGILFLTIYFLKTKTSLLKVNNLLKILIFLFTIVLILNYALPQHTIRDLKQRMASLDISQGLKEISPKRYKQWKYTTKIIENRPLRGIGIGNFRRVMEKKYYPNKKAPATPHNSYLYILGELGIGGLLFFLIVVFVALGRLFKVLFKKKISIQNRWVILSSCTLLITYSFHFLFTSLFNFIFFWIIYSLCLSSWHMLKKQ